MATRKLVVEVIGDASSLDKTFRKATSGATRFDATMKKRGMSLGKSLAAGFGIGFGVAGVVRGLEAVIGQATEAAVTQKQLAAQFKASGQNLAQYQEQIDKTVNSLSIMAGIDDEEVTQAFTSAFRATKNVTDGLRLTAIAADVAKARNTSLASATLALNKAYAGQTAGLKRLGIVIPKNLQGMQALEFVGRKFAGQAAAGTTAQQRFTVALQNMEEAIGTALLPTFNKLVNRLTVWLGDSENQAKVQQTVTDVVNQSAAAFQALAGAVGTATDAYRKLGIVGKVLFKPGFGIGNIVKVVGAIFGGPGDPNKALAAKLRGMFDTSDRQPGRSLQGPGGGAAAAVSEAAVAANATKPGPLGFNARMAKLDIAFAKAQMTQGQKDDRAVLVAQAQLVKQRISRVKSLKDRRELYAQLANIDGQIRQIDKDAQDAVDAANRKKLEAKQEEARKAKAHADKIRAAEKAAAQKAKEARQAAAAAMADAIAGARGIIGALFGGPVLSTPTGIMGIPNARAIGGRTGIGALTADVKAQAAQGAAFLRDLITLKRRGASAQLISELQAQGVAGAGFAHTLATAKRGDLNQFLKAFSKREKVIQQIANAEIAAKNVVIHAGNVRGSATTPASQRRGRQSGVRLDHGAVL